MTDKTALLDRVETLEMRLAYQEQAIEDLSDTITMLWSRIESLSRQVAALGDRVKATESDAGAGHPQVPPPHY
ncbi:SlyX family protein [Lichenihabitans sp. PAMC28606]|uniref:SlyX family protein n=1 Tax=Lichenihabitans sp. PAMC28606 TaxID=2880932 RepID=UPI001D0B9205|nr:SlyX family protein [Lichenihabitans sp. PAMC28606]UDL96318.1 SlyX family protein [Lichenihabitans sp. PAMC28606]